MKGAPVQAAVFPAEVGYFLLSMGLMVHLLGAGLSVLAVGTRRRGALVASRNAALLGTAFATLAALVLGAALWHHDYRLSYVYRNSSHDLPWWFLISAFWSSLEGSHFLWLLLLGAHFALASVRYRPHNEHLMPWVTLTLHTVQAWMFYLAVGPSNPFALQFPTPPAGLGMNALLQNPYMMIHPPALFSGYTALAIPFAYAAAALFHGDVSEGWLTTVRRWTLYGWCWLTVGIALGGRWAYVELGWAGYWAWDPVENSSFLPWLFATASLHALIVQDKLGHLKRVSIVTSGLAFFFSFFGTFITRSGVISSVHSFAQSPIGPNYLYFLAALSGCSVVLYAIRAPGILPARVDKIWGLSKESALVVAQFLLATFALVVFVGTVYPILSEAITGVRFHVQAPYFNAFAPYLGFFFAAAVGLGNLLRFTHGWIPGGRQAALLLQLAALPLTAIFATAGEVWASPPRPLAFQLVGIHLCFWCFGCLVYDLVARLRSCRGAVGLFLRRNLSYVGAWWAHSSLMLAILGFLGNYRGLEQTLQLRRGESVEVLGLRFDYAGLRQIQRDNARVYVAPLTVFRDDGTPLGKVQAERALYPTSDQMFHEVGILSTFWRDIYVVLSDFSQDPLRDEVSLQVFLNPTVRLVWWSIVGMVLGGLVALLDATRGRRSRDHAAAV